MIQVQRLGFVFYDSKDWHKSSPTVSQEPLCPESLLHLSERPRSVGPQRHSSSLHQNSHPFSSQTLRSVPTHPSNVVSSLDSSMYVNVGIALIINSYPSWLSWKRSSYLIERLGSVCRIILRAPKTISWKTKSCFSFFYIYFFVGPRGTTSSDDYYKGGRF